MTRPLLALFAALCVGLAPFAVRAQTAPGDHAVPGAWRLATVVVETSAGARVGYTVELAVSAAERRTGLMGRRTLAPDAGMLFDFGYTQPLAMWMRNTYIPLDMLFADAAGVIVDVITATTPLSEALLIPRAPARYVLELCAGQATAQGIARGDRLRLPAALRTSP